LEPRGQAASAVPEWAALGVGPPAAAPHESFLGGVASGAAREEAFDLASLEQTSQATMPRAGPYTWSAEMGSAGREAAFDAGMLNKELSEIQRVAAAPMAELAELAGSRTHSQTELESELSTASRAAGALARDAATLSEELSKINGLLRGSPAHDDVAERSAREPLGLMTLAPAQLHKANATANATQGRQALLNAQGLKLATNSTNSTNTTQEEATGFKKYFTLGNKISFGWAVVYWIAMILIFLTLCGWCCCWRLRRA